MNETGYSNHFIFIFLNDFIFEYADTKFGHAPPVWWVDDRNRYTCFIQIIVVKRPVDVEEN